MRPIFIDVREPEEFAGDHVAGALNIPPARLMAGATELDDVAKDAQIVLYCKSGARSNTSMHILRGLGFENVTNGVNKEQVRARYNV